MVSRLARHSLANRCSVRGQMLRNWHWWPSRATFQAEGFGLIDCQVHSDHLVSMGAEEISRRDFQEKLSALLSREERPGAWKTPPNDLLENPS